MYYVINHPQPKLIDTVGSVLDNAAFAAALAKCEEGDLIGAAFVAGNASRAEFSRDTPSVRFWVPCDQGVHLFADNCETRLNGGPWRPTGRLLFDRGSVGGDGLLLGKKNDEGGYGVYREDVRFGHFAALPNDEVCAFRDGVLVGKNLSSPTVDSFLRLEYLTFDDDGQVRDRVQVYRGPGYAWRTDGQHRIMVARAVGAKEIRVFDGDNMVYTGEPVQWHPSPDGRVFFTRSIPNNLYRLTDGARDYMIMSSANIGVNAHGVVFEDDKRLLQLVLRPRPAAKADGATAAPTADTDGGMRSLDTPVI